MTLSRPLFTVFDFDFQSLRHEEKINPAAKKTCRTTEASCYLEFFEQ